VKDLNVHELQCTQISEHRHQNQSGAPEGFANPQVLFEQDWGFARLKPAATF
jgi:hypothetical protein